MVDRLGEQQLPTIQARLIAYRVLLALAATVTVKVLERTREIGVLRAIGTGRGQVQGMVAAESLLVAVLGTAIGLLLRVGMAWVLLCGVRTSGLSYLFTFPAMALLIATATGLILGSLAARASARPSAHPRMIDGPAHE